MQLPRIVVDTCVVIAALRSRRGPSQRFLRLIGTGVFETALSVPLLLEYEEVSKRLIDETDYTLDELVDILDYLCSSARHYKVNFLWRPFLRDADDDMVLELAVAAGCQHIVTYNVKDFTRCDVFGIQAIKPSDFLLQLKGKP